MKTLRLFPDLKLPADAVTRQFADVSRDGIRAHDDLYVAVRS